MISADETAFANASLLRWMTSVGGDLRAECEELPF